MVLGVTAALEADYNQSGSSSMTRRINRISLYFAGIPPVLGVGLRAIWSRTTSTRADLKLAPCMARPNLFSGD